MTNPSYVKIGIHNIYVFFLCLILIYISEELVNEEITPDAEERREDDAAVVLDDEGGPLSGTGVHLLTKYQTIKSK